MLSFQYIHKRPTFLFSIFYNKLMDFIQNPDTLLQAKGIYSKPRNFIPNPPNPWTLFQTNGNLLQTQGIYSKPRKFTPNPGKLGAITYIDQKSQIFATFVQEILNK